MATGAGPVDGEWASFVAAPPPVRRVAEDWLAGLARNPAAPTALLVRLLDTDAFLHVLYRPDLPAKVVDAAFWHPSEGVRWQVWETQPLAADHGHRGAAPAAQRDRRRGAEPGDPGGRHGPHGQRGDQRADGAAA
jgi:hypothetical protein